MASLIFDIFARDKTAQAFASVKNNVEGVNKSFDKVGRSINIFKGLLVGTWAFSFLNGAAQAAERINDLSTKLGISAEVLSQYQLVANNTGVSLDDIGGAMQKLAKNSVDAAEKGGAAADALKYLGIDAQNFAALPIDDKFSTLASAINQVEDPSKRVQLAMDLMGKSGADMLQVMAGGGEALNAMQQEANNLNITLRESQVVAIDGMMDAFGKLGLSAKGLAQDFLAFLAPAITWITEKVTQAVGSFKVFDHGMTKIGWGAVSLGNKIGIVSDETYKLATIEAWERINSDVKEANGSLGEQQKLLEKIRNSMNNTPLTKAIEKSKKSAEEAGSAGVKAAKDIEGAFTPAANSINKDMSEALNGISVDFKDMQGTAISALNAIGEAILKNIVNQQFGQAATASAGKGIDLGGLTDAIGSWFGSIDAFASGGDHAGGLRIVGENGPELEATGSSRIFNADQTKSILSGVGSGGDGNIQVTYNIDARGAEQGVETRIMKVVQQLNASVESRAVAAVANAKRRNPNLL